MSARRKVADAERTATMLDLVHAMYPTGDDRLMSHVVIEEVAPGSGYRYAQRFADVLALSVWPSRGLTLDGFEIKASRTDLRRELCDLSKHQAVARYCDSWTLVAWDESVLCENLPSDWGIMVTVEGEHGRELKAVRRAPKRTPELWPREFVCSLVRNAFQQAPGAALLARVASKATEDAARAGRDEARRQVRDTVRPLAKLLFGPNDWRWPSEANDAAKVIALAVERLTAGVDVESGS